MPTARLALERLGGCATRRQLLQACTDNQLRRGVKGGDILRLRRGRYALPSVEQHRIEAHRRSAVLSHLSAAQAHGWPVKWPPHVPWITVPRNRKVGPT